MVKFWAFTVVAWIQTLFRSWECASHAAQPKKKQNKKYSRFFLYLCGNSQEINLKKKENEVGTLTLPDFKIYYKVIVTKRIWHWHQDSPEIDSNLYSKLTFDKGAPKQFNREKTFWTNCFGDNWISVWERMNSESYLHTKHNC